PTPTISPEEALRSEERLTRALLQAVEVVARELERRIGPPPSEASRPTALGDEMARLSRRVALKLGLDRRAADEIGTAPQLFVVDGKLRRGEGRAGELFAELGWPAARDEGLLPILRALTAASAGFGRAHQAAPPLGARIITVVDDYLELGAASGEVDLGTV